MIFDALTIGGLRVLVIDDFYTPGEIEAVKQEAQTLSAFARGPEASGAAKDRKRGRALILDRFYEDIIGNRSSSPMLGAVQKFLDPQLQSKAVAVDASYRHLARHQHRFSILNFYADGDYYDSHTDNCALSAVTMFGLGSVRGGDLLFEEYDCTIPFQDNRAVVFPSSVLHAATPVTAADGSLRCSVATFFRYP